MDAMDADFSQGIQNAVNSSQDFEGFGEYDYNPIESSLDNSESFGSIGVADFGNTMMLSSRRRAPMGQMGQMSQHLGYNPPQMGTMGLLNLTEVQKKWMWLALAAAATAGLLWYMRHAQRQENRAHGKSLANQTKKALGAFVKSNPKILSLDSDYPDDDADSDVEMDQDSE